MNPKVKHFLRLVISLAVVGLCSGFVLAGVYQVTLPTIQRNRAEALQKAIFKVLPGTVKTAALKVEDGGLVPFEGEVGAASGEELIYIGLAEDGSLIGYAIPAEGPGFMDTISLIYGFDPERRVITGMDVLLDRETPGLGDKIRDDEDFHKNFGDLAVEPEIIPVKKGKKTQPNEVDCITGATISSEAVVSIFNRSNEKTLPLLENVRLPAPQPAASQPAPAADDVEPAATEGGSQ